MKYFKRGWDTNPKEVNKVIETYETYYKTIEKQLSDNVKQMLKARHDTHILKAYIEGKNYVMELDEKVWGKTKFIFQNATIKINGKVEDEYWLCDEIYKIKDKIEIHILFVHADVIIVCDDTFIEINEKEYFKELYEKREKVGKRVIKKEEILNCVIELYKKATHLSEEERQKLIDEALSEEIKDREMDPIFEDEIVEIVEDKESICGKKRLNNYELIIFAFAQLYKYIKYNNLEEIIEYHYTECSKIEKEKIYKSIFKKVEEEIKRNIEILSQYNDVTINKELDYALKKIIEVYNKKNISMQEKNQLYLEVANIDFNKIYKRILECIDKGLIK